MKLLSKIVPVIFLLFFDLCSSAQVLDSLSNQKQQSKEDKTKKELIRFNHFTNPQKAGALSATFPGLGQAFNKSYWKMPLIYGVSFYTLSSVFFHHAEYRVLRDALISNNWQVNPEVPIVMRGQVFYLQEPYIIDNESQYRTARDQQRSKRDLFIVYSLAVYAVNIIDAIVDAHLRDFDLSDDLSLKINPNIYTINNKFAPSISFNFNLK